jgi:hypothetical protein
MSAPELSSPTQLERAGSAADLVLAKEEQGLHRAMGGSAFDGGRNGRGKPVCSPAARPPWPLPIGAPIGTYAGNRGKPLRTCVKSRRPAEVVAFNLFPAFDVAVLLPTMSGHSGPPSRCEEARNFQDRTENRASDKGALCAAALRIVPCIAETSFVAAPHRFCVGSYLIADHPIGSSPASVFAQKRLRVSPGLKYGRILHRAACRSSSSIRAAPQIASPHATLQNSPMRHKIER